MSEDFSRDIIINRLEALTERISSFEVSLNERLNTLEAKQHDTRPIWQAVEAWLERVEQKLDRMRDKIKAFNKRVSNVETDLASLEGMAETREGDRA